MCYAPNCTLSVFGAFKVMLGGMKTLESYTAISSILNVILQNVVAPIEVLECLAGLRPNLIFMLRPIL